MIVKVDVDQARPLRMAEVARRLVMANRRLVALGQEVSPSGRGVHLWVRVQPSPRTAVEVVALQLLLGSDPRREAYNLNRARAVDAGQVRGYWRRHWNVFYRRAS